MGMQLFEILVPAEVDGKEIPVEFHHAWDEKVRKIAGGLSILKSMKGQWVNKEGNLFAEKTIPVRVACGMLEIYNIAKMTQEYYNQEAIMVYRVSDMVMFVERGKGSLSSWPLPTPAMEDPFDNRS